MVMEAVIASAIVSPIAKKLFSLATSLGTEKYQLFQGLEESIEDLSSQLSAIIAVLHHAEEKQLDSPPIRDWLGKLKEVLYDAEDILETFETEAQILQRKQQVRNIQLPFSTSLYSSKMSSAEEIKKLLVRLEKIGKEKQNFQLNVHQLDNGSSLPSRESRDTGSMIHQSDVVGREDDVKALVELLLSEKSGNAGNVFVAPIIGMGGLGKTTLAQMVYNDDRVKSHFQVRLWVCVTDIFSYTKVLRDMIQYHTEMKYNDLNSVSNDQLESSLLEFLKGKPFLLVLDDVWPESFRWDKLQTLLKHGGEGCRVVVTSRSVRVSEIMRTLPPYFLGQLPEDQCLSLFSKIAFEGYSNMGASRHALEEIGKEVVLKCKGLPLAVKAMGGLLRGIRDVKKWRNILKHEIWEAENNNDARDPEIVPVLTLSYIHLRPHLKQCFAYCCIYPKAYAFRKMDLIKVWNAAALILPREQDSADDIGAEYFDELLARSFFQLSRVDNQEIFMMHDLHHDLAHSVSGPYCHQIKENEPCNLSAKVRHVSLLCNIAAKPPIVEALQKSEKLRTLLSPTDHPKAFGQALDRIFLTKKYIRILDLSSSVMLELPESVGDLKLLRYLNLSKTEIRRLPNSICNLINLETLILLACSWLFELPKDLGQLTNLKHLELEEMFWYKLTTLPPRIGCITGLQNLHTFPVSQEAGHGINELKEMLHLKGALHIKQLESATNAREANLKDKEGLVNVTFEWSNRNVCPQDEAADESILEDLQPHPDIKKLQVIRYHGNRFPSWMRDGLVNNLVSLSLNHCINCKILSLAQLSHLRNLSLKGNLELEEWIDAPYHFLQRLKISNCPKLRGIPKSFVNVGVMKIKRCNSLKALPLIPSVQFLTLIDNLVLENFNEEIVVLAYQGQPVQEEKPSFIELLELKIINCPELPSLPQIFAPQKLEISSCLRITTLPAPQL